MEQTRYVKQPADYRSLLRRDVRKPGCYFLNLRRAQEFFRNPHPSKGVGYTNQPHWKVSLS